MIIKGVVTQSGADTLTAGLIDTQLSADGKSGWQINRFKAWFANGHTIPAADSTVSCVLATVATVTLPNDTREIARISWGIQNTAGVAVAFNFEATKESVILEPRLTVQPALYVQVSSSGTTIANQIYYEIEAEIVKLADLEVLRLLVGGS